MMVVEIKNSMLEQAQRLLFDLKLKGKASRHRTKLIRKLQEQREEVAEQERELLKEHAHLDEDERPKTKEAEGGQIWDLKDPAAFVKDKRELYGEKLVLDSRNDQDMLQTVGEVLLHCEKEFSGQEAIVYDYLCDQFEQEGNDHE